MSKSVAYKHYIRALSRWPRDSLRPECQFQEVLRQRLDRRFIPASSSDPSRAANSPVDEKVELENANALYSLLGNRYTQAYPMNGNIMKPPSNPTHFEDLIKEMEEAPQRSWWERMTKHWKGMLRF